MDDGWANDWMPHICRSTVDIVVQEYKASFVSLGRLLRNFFLNYIHWQWLKMASLRLPLYASNGVNKVTDNKSAVNWMDPYQEQQLSNCVLWIRCCAQNRLCLFSYNIRNFLKLKWQARGLVGLLFVPLIARVISIVIIHHWQSWSMCRACGGKLERRHCYFDPKTITNLTLKGQGKGRRSSGEKMPFVGSHSFAWCLTIVFINSIDWKHCEIYRPSSPPPLLGECRSSELKTKKWW